MLAERDRHLVGGCMPCWYNHGFGGIGNSSSRSGQLGEWKMSLGEEGRGKSCCERCDWLATFLAVFLHTYPEPQPPGFFFLFFFCCVFRRLAQREVDLSCLSRKDPRRSRAYLSVQHGPSFGLSHAVSLLVGGCAPRVGVYFTWLCDYWYNRAVADGPMCRRRRPAPNTVATQCTRKHL